MSADLQKLRAALEAPFPAHAIKEREGGGRKMLSYVETHTDFRRLNEATGGCWDFHVTRLEWHGDLLMATGELTIPGMGTRTGIGVQKVSERGGEDLVKGAASDSLKKSATLFGVGLELYGPDLEAESYQPAQARETPRPAPTTPRPAPAPHSAPQAAQQPANVTTLPVSSGLPELDKWLSAGRIALEEALSWLKVASLSEWKAAHPDAKLPQLKAAILDARNVALGNLPAEASS